ncbi:MAG: hypothetical protein QOE86_3281 [Solirubrobacteraceae bacterium]|nr:hypothetical protein [Solirubrobacteraceae bacterium]
MLTAVLIAVAFVAGLAGGWSPCGLSMVETLAPAGYAGRGRTAIAGSLAFALGALAGGAATFGGLALIGDRAGAGGGAAAAVAVAALLTAAAGDAAGRRILPQVRRQVPESWRRVLPLPLAAGLYGILLGLGFTTFVLSFATWALAAASLAVGTPVTGLAIGLAFGAGRAVPVLALAPLLDRDGPAAVAAGMAERPVVLRGLRATAAAGLALAAALLVAAPPAARAAAEVFVDPGANPSAGAGTIAWQNGTAALLLRAGQTEPVTLPGAHPAVAAGRVAYASGDGRVVIADAATLATVASYAAPGADAVGLSDQLVTWRAADPATTLDVIYAHRLDAPETDAPVVIGAAGAGGSLGRPAADGTHVVFDSQTPYRSRLFDRDVATNGLAVLRQARIGDGLLLAPDLDAGRLLYVRSTARRQEVRLGAAYQLGTDRTLYSTTPTARRDKGYEDGHHPHHAGYPHGKPPSLPPRPAPGVTVTLWTTALDGATAYVTRLRHRPGGVTRSRILRLPLVRKR